MAIKEKSAENCAWNTVSEVAYLNGIADRHHLYPRGHGASTSEIDLPGIYSRYLKGLKKRTDLAGMDRNTLELTARVLLHAAHLSGAIA